MFTLAPLLSVVKQAYALNLTVMSVALSNNVQSTAAVSWTVQFNTATTGNITKVKLIFASGVNLAAGPVALGTVSGLAGTTLDATVGQVVTVDTNDASVTAGTTISIQLTGITNPSSAGNYSVGIVTDVAAGRLDQGATLGYLDADGAGGGITDNQVSVSAEVYPVIEFGIFSDTALTTGTNVCAIGVILTSTTPFCDYYLKVGTNSAAGYTLKFMSDGNLLNGSDTINAIAGNNQTIDAGTEEYGFKTTQIGTSTTTAPYNNSNFNIIPTSATSVSTSTAPVAAGTGERIEVRHSAAISTATAATSYAQIITYTMFSN